MDKSGPILTSVSSFKAEGLWIQGLSPPKLLIIYFIYMHMQMYVAHNRALSAKNFVLAYLPDMLVIREDCNTY